MSFGAAAAVPLIAVDLPGHTFFWLLKEFAVEQL